MGDTVEFWIVDEATGENVLLIEARRRCRVDRVELDDAGVCPACGLNWVEWDWRRAGCRSCRSVSSRR